MRPVTEHGRTMWMSHGCRCQICHTDLLRYARIRRVGRQATFGVRGGMTASGRRKLRALARRRSPLVS